MLLVVVDGVATHRGLFKRTILVFQKASDIIKCWMYRESKDYDRNDWKECIACGGVENAIARSE